MTLVAFCVRRCGEPVSRADFKPEDIRNYQFGEVQNYLKSMSAAMEGTGANYLTVVGGYEAIPST